ncbi:MAG: hypothetical protein HY321_02945, partial [Armatimonadetes bacterium]|nr:hypothetical protein [Armatimonadota bacterium]
GGRFDLVSDGLPTALIVLGNPPTRQSEIAAEEINDAIQAACGVALPVKRAGALTTAERETASLILMGGPGENALLTEEGARFGVQTSATDPGPQGYTIRFGADGERRLALLVGSDPLGTLYAGVTFRGLIRGETGRAHALEADIRDWPDVRWRFVQTTPRGSIEGAREQIDFLLRHKVNAFASYHAGTKAQHAQGGEERQAWYRELFQYAFERGLWGWTIPVHDNLGWAPEGQNRPELDVCVRPRGVGYWCWSRDEMMDRRFEEAAREVAANLPADPGIGGMLLWLHLPDSGNMGWHNRCRQCRERFGNDQATAQAHVFNRFYQAMRRHIPNSKLILIPRPYACWDLNAPMNTLLRDRIANIARSIPADSYINHNAGNREAIRSWVEAVGDRGLAKFGYESARSDYFAGREDILMVLVCSPYKAKALRILTEVEYLWNVNAPGSEETHLDREHPYDLIAMDEGDTPADHGKHPGQFPNSVTAEGISIYASRMLPPERRWGREGMGLRERIARSLFGEQAAPYLVLAEGAESIGGIGARMFDFVPPILSGWPYVPVTAEQMAGAGPILAAGAEALDKVHREGIPINPEYQDQGLASPGRALALHLAASLARAWAPLLRARDAADASRWSDAADAAAEAARVQDAEADRLRALYAGYGASPDPALARLRAVTEFPPPTSKGTLGFYLAISKARAWVPLVKAQRLAAAAEWTAAAQALTEAEKALESETGRLRAAVGERYRDPLEAGIQELRDVVQPELERLRGQMKRGTS